MSLEHSIDNFYIFHFYIRSFQRILFQNHKVSFFTNLERSNSFINTQNLSSRQCDA